MRRLLFVIALEVVAVWVTHTLATPYRSDLSVAWLRAADVQMLVLTTTHLAALAAAWWLLLGTVHDVVVAVVSGRLRGRLSGWTAAPEWVRRIIHQAIGTALMVGVSAGPAVAMSAPATPTTVEQAVVQPPVPVIGGVRSPAVTPVGSPSTTPPTAPPTTPPATPSHTDVPVPAEPPTPPAEVPTSPSSAVHIVSAGENMWVIAKATLLQRLDTVPTDRQTHAYWIRMLQTNEVRSGDPNLIYPGERLSLPDVADDTVVP